MPKLRNAETEIGKFTQWIARKCVNHDPLEEIGLPVSKRNNLPSTYRSRPTVKASVGIAIWDGVPTIIYDSFGRSFVVQVREVKAEEKARYVSAPKFKVGA